MLGYESLISTIYPDMVSLNHYIDNLDNFFDTTHPDHLESDLGLLLYVQEIVTNTLNLYLNRISEELGEELSQTKKESLWLTLSNGTWKM